MRITKTSFIAGICLWLIAFCGCNDSFMDRYPQTDIIEQLFFRTVKDLEIYTNGMYAFLGTTYWDIGSDNLIYTNDTGIYKMMRGETTPRNVGSWDGLWQNIRTVNFMLNRVNGVEGVTEEVNHYVALARLFRACLYYNLVKTYSDVPWYSIDLKDTDTEQLYRPQDPRALVVDSVMADLDFAVKHLRNEASQQRISKNAAQAFKARIALHEGTFRKYHPELRLTDGDKFLQIAVDASQSIMDSENYSLSYFRQGTLNAYETLFCSFNLNLNPEMILIQRYDKVFGVKHNAQAVFDWISGLSRSLMEDYLVINGNKTVSFQQLPGYDKMNILEVFKNRDPRLAQTFMPPGFLYPENDWPYRQSLLQGGYPQIKFFPRTYDQLSWGESYTDLPVIRYAEILLIYAEAKAELGLLTQQDIDRTINLIRQRAGVPIATLDEWTAYTDPAQKKQYPNIISAQESAVLEIRRERRIELACEGFRLGDLKRWACGKLLEKDREGIYIDKMGIHDITGSGNPDVVIVNKRADIGKIPESLYKDATVYILEDNVIELSEGDKGYIRLTAQHNRFKFLEPRYYYYPLDEQDLLINKNLYQNKFWSQE